MSKLLIDDYPIQVLPKLAEKIGLNEAIILQQIHYWLKTTKHFYDGKRWIFNSYPNWVKQFPFWSERTIKRIFTSLEKQELLFVGNYNKAGFDRTKWYSINYETLNELVARPSGQNGTTSMTNCHDGRGQNVTTNTRDYTETTTERRDTRARASSKFNNTNNSNSEHDSKYQEIVEMYEKNFRIINGNDHDIINHWLNDFEEKGSQEAVEIMLYAMKVSIENNAYTFNYVQKVLNNWWQRNLITLEDVKKANKQPRKKKTRSNEKKNWDNINLDEIENSKDKNDDMWNQFLDL